MKKSIRFALAAIIVAGVAGLSSVNAQEGMGHGSGGPGAGQCPDGGGKGPEGGGGHKHHGGEGHTDGGTNAPAPVN